MTGSVSDIIRIIFSPTAFFCLVYYIILMFGHIYYYIENNDYPSAFIFFLEGCVAGGIIWLIWDWILFL